MVPSYPSQSEKRSEEIAAGQPGAAGKESEVEVGRKLFAHFLWSAAMVVAEGVEEGGGWTVDGERVLELGAGLFSPFMHEGY